MLDLDKKQKALNIYKGSLGEIYAVLDCFKDNNSIREYNTLVEFLGQLYAASGEKYMSSDPEQCSSSQKWLLINGKRELNRLIRLSRIKTSEPCVNVLKKLSKNLKTSGLTQ